MVRTFLYWGLSLLFTPSYVPYGCIILNSFYFFDTAFELLFGKRFSVSLNKAVIELCVVQFYSKWSKRKKDSSINSIDIVSIISIIKYLVIIHCNQHLNRQRNYFVIVLSLICNCPVLNDISFNTKRFLVWFN